MLVTDAGVEDGRLFVPTKGMTRVTQSESADLLHGLRVPHGYAVVAAITFVAHGQKIPFGFIPDQAQTETGLAGDWKEGS